MSTQGYRPLPRLCAAILLLLLGPAAGRAADNFLDVDAAFTPAVSTTSDGRIAVHFEIAPHYYLYRERIAVEADPAQVQLPGPELPSGQLKHDPNFDRDMEVYHEALAFTLAPAPLGKAASAPVRLSYQGCAEAGLCYPPQTRLLRVDFSPRGAVVQAVLLGDAASPAVVANPPPAPRAVPPAPDEGSRLRDALGSGRLLTISGVFLLAGLLLSFTPCVLPMVPILSAIIVGDRGAPSRARSFSLALAYALGMALVYTAFGVVAGLLGEGLAASLQNRWVLGAFGLLMVGLALSMFDVYTLQVPSFIQSRMTQASGKLQGGTYAGVFVMGGLSALIVGPCVAAPLAGALVYISQTRDVLVGAAALFSLACGMSVPLLLVGLSAGSLLPRAGRWMESVKTAMGMLMLAVAWWLVSPVLPAPASMLLAAAWLTMVALLLGAFAALDAQAGIGRQAGKAVGLVLACIGIAQVLGALSGAASPWQPLSGLGLREAAAAGAAAPGPAFEKIESLDRLDQALSQARGRPVMLDFYADWCVACKEFEHETFADPRVREQMSRMVLLQADVTGNTDSQRAMLKRYGLFGPPGILFFDGIGREVSARRVVGFQDAERFLASVARVEE